MMFMTSKEQLQILVRHSRTVHWYPFCLVKPRPAVVTYTEAMKAKLDAIRRKPKKFICINDILDHDKSDTEEVLKITKDWYAKMFREKSPFEL